MKLLLIILLALSSILIIFVLVTLRAASQFESEIRNDLKIMLNESLSMDKRPITQADLTGLPEIVKKYIRYVNVIGTTRISTVRIKQRGRIRNAPDQKWMDFTADEYFRVKPPGFIWHAKFGPAWLPMVQVRDHYLNGSGRMLGKFLSLRPIVDAKGPEIDQGSIMRFFNEIMWFPTAYLADNIAWETIDDLSARATFKDGVQQIEAVFFFNEKGEMINFEADRYYTTPDGEYKFVKWSTPIGDYREFDGIRLPTRGSGVWHLPEGSFSYIELELLEVEYDPLVRTLD